MKKDRNLPNKKIQSKKSSRKPLTPSYSNSRSQSTFSNNFRGRSQQRRKSQNIPNIDIVDQIVRTIITETIIHYLTLIGVVILIIIEIDHVQIIKTDINQTTAQKTLRTTRIEIIQLIAIGITQIKNPRTTQITYNLIETITTDLTKTPITLDLEIVANKIYHEIVLNDHIEIIHKIQIDKSLINLL